MARIERGRVRQRGVDGGAGVRSLGELGAQPAALGDAAALAALGEQHAFDGALCAEVLFARQQTEDDRGQAEDVARRAHVGAVLLDLLGRGVAGRAAGRADEGAGRRALFARDAEVGDLEQLVGAEAAAEDVPRRHVAVHDAHLVDGLEPARQTRDGERGAVRIESVAGLLDGEIDALVERRALGAAVHVLEREPRQLHLDAALGHAHGAAVDQAHDEGRRRDALVQAAQRDRLLVDREPRRLALLAHHARPDDLQHHGRVPLGRAPEREERHGEAAGAERPVELVAHLALVRRLQRQARQRAEQVVFWRDQDHNRAGEDSPPGPARSSAFGRGRSSSVCA